uniref:Putative tail protein n=1 Tax=viral metagenome TaxID=1070528 RepID=A0A6M3IMF2_9ZZZZ
MFGFSGFGSGVGDIVAFVKLGGTSEFNADLARLNTSVNGASQTMNKVLNVSLMAGIAAFTAATLAAAKFESSFAGVTKTVEGLRDPLGNLNEDGIRLARQFRDLAMVIPLSVHELAKIGELGGQLSIPQQDLISFTDTIAKLSVTTDLTLESASMNFARFVNITQQVAPEGMTAAAQIERLGSTIVDLGNRFATTESQILEMSMRLAGSGAQIGLTQPQIMGLATALSSVGLEAQAGGTSISKAMIEIANSVATGNEKLETFAEVAGMSIEAFSKLFEEDAAQALTLFITGLGDVELQGGNTFQVIEDLGMSDIRLRDALLRASSASDLFSGAIARGTVAFRENNALAVEANQRFATLESQFKIFRNIINDVFISIGNEFIPVLTDLLEVLNEHPETIQAIISVVGKAIIVFGALAAAIKIVTISAGLFGASSSALLATLGPIGLAIGAIATAIIALDAVNQWYYRRQKERIEAMNEEEVLLRMEKLEKIIAETDTTQRSFGMATAEVAKQHKEAAKELALLQTQLETIRNPIEQVTIEEQANAEAANIAAQATRELANSNVLALKALEGMNYVLPEMRGRFQETVEPARSLSDVINGVAGRLIEVESATGILNKTTDITVTNWDKMVFEMQQVDKYGLKNITLFGNLAAKIGGFGDEVSGTISLLSNIIQGGLDPLGIALSVATFAFDLFGGKGEENMVVVQRSAEEVVKSLEDIGIEVTKINALFDEYGDKIASPYLTRAAEMLAEYQRRLELATGSTREFYEEQARMVAEAMGERLGVFTLDEQFRTMVQSIEFLVGESNRLFALFGEAYDPDPINQLLNEQIIIMERQLRTLDPASEAYRILSESIRQARGAIWQWDNVLGEFIPPAEKMIITVGALDDTIIIANDDMYKISMNIDRVTKASDLAAAQLMKTTREWFAQRDAIEQTKMQMADIRTQIAGYEETIRGLEDRKIEIGIKLAEDVGEQEAIITDLNAIITTLSGGTDIDFYEIAKSLEELIDISLALTIQWEDMLNTMFQDYTAMEQSFKTATETIDQLLYFAVDLDTTQADEQINAMIFLWQDYINSLNPGSKAQIDAQAGLDALIVKFLAMGGILSEEMAIQFNTDQANSGIDIINGKILKLQTDAAGEIADIDLDISAAQSAINQLALALQALVDLLRTEYGLTIKTDKAIKALDDIPKDIFIKVHVAVEETPTIPTYKYTAPAYQEGGLLMGGLYYGHPNEYVLNEAATAKLGIANVDTFNQTLNPSVLGGDRGSQAEPVVIVNQINNATRQTWIRTYKEEINPHKQYVERHYASPGSAY